MRPTPPRGSGVAAVASLFALAGSAAGAGENIDRRDVRTEYEPVDAYAARLVDECVRYAHGQLRTDLGLAIPPRVTVRLIRKTDAFRGLSRGKWVELYAGMAYPDSATIHVNMDWIDRDVRPDAYTKTIRHELVHLAVAYTLGKREFPKWFEEGLACRFGSPLPRGEVHDLSPGGTPALASLAEFPDEQEALGRAYAQADSVMRFLVKRRGSEAVKRALHLVGAGEDFDDALEKATGYTTDSLDAAWREWLWPSWGMRVIAFLFAPSMVLLWTALIAVAGYFIVKRRRRREADAMDSAI